MKSIFFTVASAIVSIASVHCAPKADPFEIPLSIDESEITPPKILHESVNLRFGRDVEAKSKTYSLDVPIGELAKGTNETGKVSWINLFGPAECKIFSKDGKQIVIISSFTEFPQSIPICPSQEVKHVICQKPKICCRSEGVSGKGFVDL